MARPPHGQQKIYRKRVRFCHPFTPVQAEGAHMKTTTRSNIYLAMAAMILTALAVPAAATQIPLKGTFFGNDIVSNEGPCPTTVCTKGTGTGTHLGQLIRPGSYDKLRE